MSETAGTEEAASDASGAWYGQGLRFRCTRCRQCCTGEPGYVWVTKDRATSIADFLAIPVKEFLNRYCRRVWLRTSLKEMPNGDCVLLTANGCAVYPVRPEQCRAFPFWSDALQDPKRWEALARCCQIGRAAWRERV